jgi:aerobic C4-dicarboxylate transport protein
MISVAATETTSPARPAKPWYRQLWAQVLLGMAAGILLGYVDPALGERMAPLGDAFIKAIRMLIAPIIFCTVVHGIARMADMARVGRVAIKALIYFEVLTTIALVIGLAAANLWRPGAGMNVDLSRIDTSAVSAYVAQTQKQDTATFLINIIPNTLVGAFAEGNVLQVLFIAVLCGFALTWIGPRAQPLLDIIEIVSSMLFNVVAMVMWAAPLGAFGAIAFTVGKFGAGSLLSLGKLLGGFYVTCLIFIFCVLGPIAHWCGFSLLKLSCEESVVGLVIPTGYSFNLDGTCLYLASAAIFSPRPPTPISVSANTSACSACCC